MGFASARMATDPKHRYSTAKFLFKVTGGWARSIEVERAIYAYASCEQGYIDKARQVCYNMRINALLHALPPRHLVAMSNAELAENTIVERVYAEQRVREKHFAELLLAKTEKTWDKGASLLRCRHCGGSDIAWEQKQTRGADEAMTIFCTCNSCKTRWKMS